MPTKKPVMINGVSYTWNNVRSTVFGVPVIGITNLTYQVNQSTTNNYGAGDEPVSYGKGAKTYTNGKMTLYKEEVVALSKASPTGCILDLPADTITVSFSGDGVNFITERIRNVRFTSDPLSTKQGDTMILCEVSFDFAGIDRIY